MKRSKPVVVRIVRRQGEAALVEWSDKDGLRRASIPASEAAGEVGSDVLDAGIPYGERWRELEGVSPELEQELYRRGVWTFEDVLKSSHQVRAAIQKVYAVPLLKELLQRAQEVAK